VVFTQRTNLQTEREHRIRFLHKNIFYSIILNDLTLHLRARKSLDVSFKDLPMLLFGWARPEVSTSRRAFSLSVRSKIMSRAERRAAARQQNNLACKAAEPAIAPEPISATRLAANRENAQKSCGPKTDAGKAISLNAVKTGLTVLLPSDDAARYEGHILAYERSSNPSAPKSAPAAKRKWLNSAQLQQERKSKEGAALENATRAYLLAQPQSALRSRRG
jgi:hypothetical protein